MCILPMETSFGHWNMLLLLQDENPIIGRICAGNPNIQFLRCLPNRDVISSLNPPNSHDPNGGTYIRIGELLKENPTPYATKGRDYFLWKTSAITEIAPLGSSWRQLVYIQSGLILSGHFPLRLGCFSSIFHCWESSLVWI